jgi:hypothetical protein
VDQKVDQRVGTRAKVAGNQKGKAENKQTIILLFRNRSLLDTSARGHSNLCSI